MRYIKIAFKGICYGVRRSWCWLWGHQWICVARRVLYDDEDGLSFAEETLWTCPRCDKEMIDLRDHY